MSSIISNAISTVYMPISIGVIYGLADTIFSTTVQKTCMIAGMQFKEIEDEDAVPSSERLDKFFTEGVIKFPIGEELIFRGILQPLLSGGLTLYFPSLLASSSLGIPIANIVSSTIIGTTFGVVHYFGYEKGGTVVALTSGVSGSFYGIIKERFGLIGSIAAHMTHNLSVGLIDKYYPSLLESETDQILKKNS